MRHPFFDLPTPLAIGHRGCAGEAPENTLAAFERGLAVGAVVLESDVQLTRDGVAVLIHDPLVDRCTNGQGAVAEHDLVSLQALDAGHRFGEAEGAPFRGRDLRVPTLAEALRSFPQARWNLELKAEAPQLVERCVADVTEHGDPSRVLLTAGDDGVMARLRAHLAATDTPVALGACTSEVAGFARAAAGGERAPAGPMALQIPASFAGQPLVTPALLEHAHAQGVQVHVWTINEPAEIEILLALGVDGIVSDHPGRVVAAAAGRR